MQTCRLARMATSVAAPLLVGALSLVALTCAHGCASSTKAKAPPPAPPPVISTNPTQDQERALEQANVAADQGKYDDALLLFRELLAENPTLVDAHLGLGRTYESMGDLAKAEPAYARAAALDADNFDAQVSLGRVLNGLRRYPDAIRAFHRALIIRPDNLEANVGMAMAYLKENQAQEALAFAQKAVELAPSDGEARVNLAVALERLGRNADAIAAYETALELVEPRADLLTSLVNLYASEKRFIEAVNTANELIRIAPSANAYERLGWSYFRTGEYEKSAEAYRKGVEIDPNHWPSLNGVATNALNKWLTTGRANDAARLEARTSFQKSLKVNPDQPKVVAILTKYQP